MRLLQFYYLTQTKKAHTRQNYISSAMRTNVERSSDFHLLCPRKAHIGSHLLTDIPATRILLCQYRQCSVFCSNMAPLTRRNGALAKKIATLQLTLAPLVPMPSGPPHPGFPKTLLAFHLLTEEELDSIAHYYHQSTPGPWSDHYPANMNWDKEFLAKRSPISPSRRRHSRRLSQVELTWFDDLMKMLDEAQAPLPVTRSSAAIEANHTSNVYTHLSDKERLRIKRRKVGKFIGLVGMETPVEEIAARIQASFDRAIERSRAEMRRNEEIVLNRKKGL